MYLQPPLRDAGRGDSIACYKYSVCIVASSRYAEMLPFNTNDMLAASYMCSAVMERFDYTKCTDA